MKQFIFIIILALNSFWHLDAQQNPFLTTGDDSPGIEKQSDITTFSSTGLLYDSQMMQKIKSIQKEIQAKISTFISEYQGSREHKTLFAFLISAFLYGLLHVLGPGHRKVFLFSYFVSKPTRWKQGMLAGFMMAVLHAVSAIMLIGGLYFITTKALLTRFNNITPILERISYGAIAAMGGYLLIYHITGWVKKDRQKDDANGRNPDTYIFVFASGLIPCPGAATIMIFSLAAGAPLLGIYAVAAMSLGMAAVLSLIPPAAILIQNRLDPLIKKTKPGTGERIHFIVSLAGAAFLVLFGTLLII